MLEVLISVITMYITSIIIVKDEISKYQWGINIIITTIGCYIINLIDRRYNLLAFIAISSVIIYINIKNIKKTCILIVITLLINIISGYINTIIYYKIINLFPQLEGSQIVLSLLYIIIFILVIIMSKGIDIIINLRSINFSNKNKYLIVTIVLTMMFIGIIIVNLIFGGGELSSSLMVLYSILIVIIASIIIFMIYMAMKSEQKAREIIEKDNELKSLMQYIESTESYYISMRKFKHDYINIISTIGGYIDDNNMDSLREYFENNILPLSKVFSDEVLQFNSIGKINLPEVKGLIKIKLAEALSKEIKVSVEVVNKIDVIHWDVIELCRTIGILLDNAIEATEGKEDAFISVAIFSKNDDIYIIVQNSFYGQSISIQQIYKKGFSTKGEERGLGLATVQELVNKSNNISIETSIENSVFTQILKIEN